MYADKLLSSNHQLDARLCAAFFCKMLHVSYMFFAAQFYVLFLYSLGQFDPSLMELCGFS